MQAMTRRRGGEPRENEGSVYTFFLTRLSKAPHLVHFTYMHAAGRAANVLVLDFVVLFVSLGAAS